MDRKDRANPNLGELRWEDGGHWGGHHVVPGLVIAWMGDTPVEKGDLDGAPQKEGKQQNLPKANSSPSLSPCGGGATQEGEALAVPSKHRLLSTFICHHPASPSSSSSPSSFSPVPPTATVAGRGLRARAPHTHTPKRSLKRSNMD